MIGSQMANGERILVVVVVNSVFGARIKIAGICGPLVITTTANCRCLVRRMPLVVVVLRKPPKGNPWWVGMVDTNL